jgi:hypothetical protein
LQEAVRGKGPESVVGPLSDLRIFAVSTLH